MWVFFVFVFIALIVFWAGHTLVSSADENSPYREHKFLIALAWIIIILVVLGAAIFFIKSGWKRY